MRTTNSYRNDLVLNNLSSNAQTWNQTLGILQLSFHFFTYKVWFFPNSISPTVWWKDVFLIALLAPSGSLCTPCYSLHFCMVSRKISVELKFLSNECHKGTRITSGGKISVRCFSLEKKVGISKRQRRQKPYLVCWLNHDIWEKN